MHSFAGLHVLIVEDWDDWYGIFARPIIAAGAHVDRARTDTAAITAIRKNLYDVILLDLKLDSTPEPESAGLRVLKYIRDTPRRTAAGRTWDPVVIVVTIIDRAAPALEATRLGVDEFLVKTNVAGYGDFVVERIQHWRTQRMEPRAHEFIFASPPMVKLNKHLERLAASDTPVLIIGETGTGKEVIAQRLHTMSPTRRRKSFVRVDCTTLPEHLAEAELFGSRRGAFTDAIDRAGQVTAADGGTLFFDEIGDLNLVLQAKLLPFLDRREYKRVGGNDAETVDARFIAATNRDLDDMINRNAFRTDLYYRLKGGVIKIPPLRERGDDVILLARYFLVTISKTAHKIVTEINTEALNALRSYSWPGNVRQLMRVIEQAVVADTDGVIGVDDLVSEIIQGPIVATIQAAIPQNTDPAAQLRLLLSNAPLPHESILSLLPHLTVRREKLVLLPKAGDRAAVMREAITRLRADGLSYRTIGDTLGVSVMGISKWMRRQNAR